MDGELNKGETNNQKDHEALLRKKSKSEGEVSRIACISWSEWPETLKQWMGKL